MKFNKAFNLVYISMYSESYILFTTFFFFFFKQQQQGTPQTFELPQERKSVWKIQSICKKFPEQFLIVEIFKQ